MPLVGGAVQADEAGTSRGRMTAYAFFVQVRPAAAILAPLSMSAPLTHPCLPFPLLPLFPHLPPDLPGGAQEAAPGGSRRVPGVQQKVCFQVERLQSALSNMQLWKYISRLLLWKYTIQMVLQMCSS